MGTILTPSEYQLLQPVNNTDVNDIQLQAYIAKGLVALLNQLPRTMQPIIKVQDFTDLPELKAFNDEYLKPWLAQIVFGDIVNFSGINVEPEGSRVLMNPQSGEVSDKRRAMLSEETGRYVVEYRNSALWKYQDVNFVFDDVAYPPTLNMGSFWQASWAGLSYGRIGLGWGWIGGGGNAAGGSIGPVAAGTKNNPRFGLNLV
jgi:hypothetical protein